jgi:hypothetical protein
MKKIALIIAYFLPKQVKHTAMLDYFDQLPMGELTVIDPKNMYILRIKKERHE